MARLEPRAGDLRVGFARLFDGAPILPKQMALLRATLPTSPVTLLATLGAWRSGKTSAEILGSLSSIVQNPWTRDYGANRPCTLMITETTTVLRDSLYDALINVWPEGLIAHEVRSPSWDILVPNGHVVALRTAAGSLEGKTVCTTIIDEVHKLRSKRNYINYRARASDGRAAKNLTICAGLPIDNGWLKQEFDRVDDPKRLTLYMPTHENVYLPPGYVDDLRSSCSAKEAKTLLSAEWQTYEGAIYDDLDSSKHYVPDLTGNAVIHIGLDAGHQGAIVVAKEKMRGSGSSALMGLHVVDEILPDSSTVERAMEMFFARGWRLTPGRSYVCVDPRIDDDQIASIRRVAREHGIRDVAIVQWSRGEPGESVKYGIRCVQRALKTGDGRLLLTFDSSLGDKDRGLRRALPAYRWNPRTREPVKDDVIDHVLDALRYVVVQIMPLSGSDIVVSPGFF